MLNMVVGQQTKNSILRIEGRFIVHGAVEEVEHQTYCDPPPVDALQQITDCQPSPLEGRNLDESMCPSLRVAHPDRLRERRIREDAQHPKPQRRQAHESHLPRLCLDGADSPGHHRHGTSRCLTCEHHHQTVGGGGQIGGATLGRATLGGPTLARLGDRRVTKRSSDYATSTQEMWN